MNPTVPVDIEIDQVRRRMAEIRQRLHQDVSGVVGRAGRAFDWRSHARDYPWLIVGVAFGLGYLIAPHTTAKPRHSHPAAWPRFQFKPPRAVLSTSPSAAIPTNEPAKREAAIGPFAILRWGWTLLGPVAIQAAQSYAASWIETRLSRYQHGGPPLESTDASRLDPAGMTDRPRRF